FSFTAKTGTAFSSAITSDPITVSGINTATPTSIVGGLHSVNGGPFTAAGTVNNGDSVRAQVMSSGHVNTQTCATLTIGGVSGQFCATTGPAPVFDIKALLPLLIDD